MRLLRPRSPSLPSLDLTIRVYTDPTLLDAAGALAALPDTELKGIAEPLLTAEET